MQSTHSRIQVLDNAPVAPGTCILCGSAGGDGRKFIDFGMQIDWIGAIYFCTECFGEAAKAVGYVHVEEFDELNKSLAAYKVELEAANRTIKRLTDALGTIFSAIGREPESVDDYISSLLESAKESSGSEGTNEVLDNGESETSEPDNVEGSDDLFDASDFDE